MKTETLDKMQKYGGSFVMQLARLWFVADQGNRDKLEAAFGDIFDRYESMQALPDAPWKLTKSSLKVTLEKHFLNNQ